LTNKTNRPTFVNTRQHERFIDLCNACRNNQYIGVCTGRSGVGKTRSAEEYSKWAILERRLEQPRQNPNEPPAVLDECFTAIYTPDMSCTIKRVSSALARLRIRFDILVQESLCWYQAEKWCLKPPQKFLELLIIDEAQRLSTPCLEVVRDFSKKHKIGVVLIGMPGFQYRIHNLDHINTSVGFYHEFNSPRTEELRAILEARWQSEQVTIEDGAVEMIQTVTASNVQKVINISAEMRRVCTLNSISIITADLVKVASKTLLLSTGEGVKV